MLRAPKIMWVEISGDSERQSLNVEAIALAASWLWPPSIQISTSSDKFSIKIPSVNFCNRAGQKVIQFQGTKVRKQEVLNLLGML